jgi:hypothetical protein
LERKDKEKSIGVIPSVRVLNARFEFLLDFLEAPDSLPLLVAKSGTKSNTKRKSGGNTCVADVLGISGDTIASSGRTDPHMTDSTFRPGTYP